MRRQALASEPARVAAEARWRARLTSSRMGAPWLQPTQPSAVWRLARPTHQLAGYAPWLEVAAP